MMLLQSESLSYKCANFTLWQQQQSKSHAMNTLRVRYCYVQLFTLVSITRDYMPRSLFYCLFVPHMLYMGVILHTHPVRGELHI